MTNNTAVLDTAGLDAAHKALMSELFLICQPKWGDVFAFMDDHPESLLPAIRAYLSALAPVTAKAVEPVGTVEALTGSLNDMAIIKWRGEQPPVGTKLYASPAISGDAATEAAQNLLASLDPDALNPEQFNAWGALTAALLQAPEGAAAGWKPTHRHLKRGSTYKIVAHGRLQTARPLEDNRDVIVYEGEDGAVWVRPYHEFHDGRFEDISAAPETEQRNG